MSRLGTSFTGLDAHVHTSSCAGGPHQTALAPVVAWVQMLRAQLSETPSLEGFADIDHTLAAIESHCEPLQVRRPEFRPPWVATALRLVREMRKMLESIVTIHDLADTVKQFVSVSTLYDLPLGASGEKSQSPSKSTPTVVTRSKARLFIGSSVEGLSVANELQALLDHDAEVTVWHQGVFDPSGGTLERLVQMAPTFDFAVLVLTPDDVQTKRDKSKNAPRDNVLFELGLFIGTLGRERTYFVHPRSDMALPSDLDGITPITYDANRSDNNLQAAIGPVATSIRNQVAKLGSRPKQ